MVQAVVRIGWQRMAYRLVLTHSLTVNPSTAVRAAAGPLNNLELVSASGLLLAGTRLTFGCVACSRSAPVVGKAN
jgi:hypothetical protein